MYLAKGDPLSHTSSLASSSVGVPSTVLSTNFSPWSPFIEAKDTSGTLGKDFLLSKAFPSDNAVTWNMCGEQLWSQRACQGSCSPRPMWGWAQTQIGGLQLRQNYETHNILVSETGRPNSHVLKTFEWETEWVGPGSRVGAMLEKEDTRDVSGLWISSWEVFIDIT